MTIALGLIASDGIVMAADTQESTGELLKGEKHKMTSLVGGKGQSPKHGGCVVSGAGDSGHVSDLILQLGFTFMGNDGLQVMSLPNDKQKTLKNEFSACLKSFYKEHVVPFASFPARDRPDVEMLIAFYRGYIPYIFCTEKTAVIQSGHYKAIGIGSTFAELLLARFYHSKMSVAEAELLAAYVVFMAKESVEHCGKYTSMLTLEREKFSPGGEDIESDGIRYTSGKTIAEWEDLFRTKWMDAEQTLMRRLIEDKARRISPKKKRWGKREEKKTMRAVAQLLVEQAKRNKSSKH
jgi:hypothetical protein